MGETWIDVHRNELFDWIDDCFDDLDVCEKCPAKCICDDIWEIVHEENKEKK